VNQLRRNIAYLRASQSESFEGIGENPTLSDLELICSRTGISIQNLVSCSLDAETLPWQDLRFVFLDVDGVMTEGGMFYTEKGDEFKRFNAKDGMAIKKAQDAGIQFGIISSGYRAEIINHRAAMFGIEHVYVGRDKKEAIAEQWLKNLGVKWSECGYIGDDVNDLGMMQRVGISAAPANAVQTIKQTATFVLQQEGGQACVREFIQYLPVLKDKL
jgi:3-deoxy-D-manno-octulosonate 8-phosphate phosphatase (KDO 8-P phosphatase)